MAASKRSGKGKAASAAPAAPAGRKDAEIARLERLLELMRDHALAELEIGANGRAVRMTKAGAHLAAAPAAAPAQLHLTPPRSGEPSATGALPSSKPIAAGEPFLSPMVGTFYRAASPEAKPFVVEGDSIKPEGVLCIIEAMKVMNEIKAERAGKVVQILVENGEAVEYGQPLFVIQRT